MDYEKKYKDALERARKCLDEKRDTCFVRPDVIFPELAESEDKKIKEDLIQWINEFPDTIWRGHYKKDIIAWLEKQSDKDKEINTFDVLPGLYKCVHRMFDGTPDGKLLFEEGEIYKCLSKHDRAEFEVSYGHSVYLEDPVVCKHFIPFEKQGEQKPSLRERYKNISESEWFKKTYEDMTEDERIRKELISFVNNDGWKFTKLTKEEKESWIAWLERQPKWTEEDEKRLQSCISTLQGKGLMGGVDTINTKWLKSLKQRMEV